MVIDIEIVIILPILIKLILILTIVLMNLILIVLLDQYLSIFIVCLIIIELSRLFGFNDIVFIIISLLIIKIVG